MSSVQNWEKEEVLFILNLQPSFNKQCFKQKLETLGVLFFSQGILFIPVKDPLDENENVQVERTTEIVYPHFMQYHKRACPVCSKEKKSDFLSL